MSKSNDFETDLLELIFNATAIANVADNAATSPITAIQISLHTADPGEGGNQGTNEATYTSYARTAVNRNSGGWTITGNLVENTALVSCPQATGGSNTITHFGAGRDNSGAGYLFYSGTVTPNLAVSNGITPEFAAGDIDITED